MDQKPAVPSLYGMMAEFEDPTAMVAAARRTHEQGYRQFDAFSPFPIHEIFEAMHLHDKRVPRIVLVGGLVGLMAGLGLQVWVSAFAYPLNIGGMRLLRWLSFVPVAFGL